MFDVLFSGFHSTTISVAYRGIRFCPERGYWIEPSNGAEYQGRCIQIWFESPPRAKFLLWGNWRGETDRDVLTVRSALDYFDLIQEWNPTDEVVAAMDRLIQRYVGQNKYQESGDASGWMGDSILGNAI